MQISDAEYDAIRVELQGQEHLPNGFYLYRGDNFDVSVVAQSPFNWAYLGVVTGEVEMIAAKFGIDADFSVKIDTPTAEQLRGLIPSVAEGSGSEWGPTSAGG